MYFNFKRRSLKFNDMEQFVNMREEIDCTITDAYYSNNKEIAINAYVRNIIWYYITGAILDDINDSNNTWGVSPDLDDAVSRIQVEIPFEISNFYMDKCNFITVMTEPET